MDFESKDFAPPAPPVDISEAMAASAVIVAQFPSGWADPAHPAPARQWLFVTKGSARLDASGESVVIGPDLPVLLEDTTGAGHGTVVLADSLAVFVRL